MCMCELNSKDFLKGMKSAVGIAIGYITVGVTYGILAKTGGLSFIETVSMSALVYAGSSQFVALNLMAMGVNPGQMVFAIFMVNIRHFLMSTSLSEKLGDHRRFLQALYSFGITDETFAVSSVKQEEVTPSFMFGLTFLAYLSWVASSGIGFILGRGIPSLLRQGMSIALYALLIGLLVPSIRKDKSVFLIAALAGGLNSAFRLALSSGWSIVASSLIAAVAGAIFFNEDKSYSPGEREGNAN